MRLLGGSESMLGAVDHSDNERVALVRRLAERPDYESCYAAGKNAPRDEIQSLVAHTLGLPASVLSDPMAGAHTLRP